MNHWKQAFHLLILIMVLGAPPPRALAHQGIHEQIEAIDLKLQKDPTNAELYLRRGDLHRLHQEWKAAEQDFKEARRLAPDGIEVDFLEGQMRLEAKEFELSKTCLDRFLERDPGHVKALTLRGRAFAALKQYREAAADYTAAIARFEGEAKPRPEMYLERAMAQAALGKDFLEAAVQGLDEGTARLGPIASLELYAVELLVERGEFETALTRVRRSAATGQNRVSWLVREAEILEAWRHEPEARAAYGKALEGLNAQGNRQTPTSLSLKARIEEALARLERGGAGESASRPASPDAGGGR